MSSKTINTVIVNILDKEYQVSCPPEQQPALSESAQHLDTQMRKIRDAGKVVGLERIAVMAALNITHELLQEKSQPAKSSESLEQLKKLNKKLDNALKQHLQVEI
jgi:cell division protein ZapA